jgi:hypothetical protein
MTVRDLRIKLETLDDNAEVALDIPTDYPSGVSKIENVERGYVNGRAYAVITLVDDL